ncbi:uncharacterized protein LOC6553755 [Drosophila erecta]|uniref:GG15346 n=1 Tax=Drosophila erecta TaxID=7220 RepID=B3NYX0_DROER|nr:uncharacterized protein LOC6553755 [Drosophila erecta]EDV48373.1 uncharacterized protein Dere_GG15346 [Drosophila erecta]
MFLNDIGQPLILEKGKAYSSYEEHCGALLFSSAALGDLITPQNWCKLAVGSQLDILRLQSQKSFSESCTFKTLLPNKPTRIVYDGNEITITLIPAGRKQNGLECHLFYIENGHTRYLIVDCLSGYLDFLPKASDCFHKGLRLGIDVLYVDEEVLVQNQINEDLYSLVDLIRPKFIYGLRQRELPKWLLDLRRIDDRNKKYSVLSVQNDAFKV